MVARGFALRVIPFAAQVALLLIRQVPPAKLVRETSGAKKRTRRSTLTDAPGLLD
jgi:hypothetical protein